jgi:hypothetical protein
LPTRHPIDTVVHNDGGEIDIPPGRMDEMIPANGYGIAIAHNDNHLEIGFRQLHSSGKGKRAAMGGMKGVEVHIDRKPS